MEKKGKILLGMSGGVDSSVSAILLQEQGYKVIGATLELFGDSCTNITTVKDAKKVCEKLGIKHITIELKKEFYKYVIKDFIDSYSICETPNPCIKCNRYIKFDIMHKKAKELGCDYLATGHYAKIEYDEKWNQKVIKKSDSIRKDQSYVLYNVKKEILQDTIFPLGEFEYKDEIREIARTHGLEVANKKDSEDICFIPDNNYVRFLEENNLKSKKGNIVDTEGNILGKHTGLYKYTIGQRKGLGISSKYPLYVVKLDKDKNEVIVGKEEEIFSPKAIITDFNNLLTENKIENMKVKAKVRYSAKEADAIINQIDDKTVEVNFLEPQRAITPGQSLVLYIDDIVLGGGKIVK